MRKIDLRKYPRFWADFTDRINKEIGPSWYIPRMPVKVYMEVWYGINVHIMPNGNFGDVYMSDKEYTSFVLQWS